MNKNSAQNRTLADRLRWLLSKEGLPVLITIIAGFIIGMFINGAVGLILSTVAGLFILKYFKRLPMRFKPWPALVTDISPVVARLLFFMIFLLPVASYLTIPGGYTPNTLTKYVSIIIAVPKTLISRPPSDVFPGLVFLVLVSIGLMLWGSSNLAKTKNWLIALGGLLLYTITPSITSAIIGDPRLRIYMPFFSIGYYCAWLGLILIMLSRFFPRWLKSGTPAGAVLNILPPVLMLGLLAQHDSVQSGSILTWLPFFDFESTHHFVAGVFSGGIAGWGAGSIVSDAAVGSTDEIPQPEEPAVDTSNPPIGVRIPSPSPDDPPGTTYIIHPDGMVSQYLPDGTVNTEYTDGTIYSEPPDGSKVTYYPDGTVNTWVPNGTTQIDRPDGTSEITCPDGKTAIIYPDGKNVTTLPDGGSVTLYPDGRVTDTKADGSSITWDKDSNVIGKTIGGDGPFAGTTATYNPDGTISVTNSKGEPCGSVDKDGKFSGSISDKDGFDYSIDKDGIKVTSPAGGSIKLDNDGNPLEGDITMPDGSRFILSPDGTIKMQTPNGDSVTIDQDGLKAKFNGGDFVNINMQGEITNAHITADDGRTIDINKDGMDVKDNKGNSAHVGKDGSIEYNDADGTRATQDAKGNASITTPEGVKWTAKADGTGTIEAPNGARADLDNNGNLTVTDKNGKVTSYTADDLNTMAGQQGGSAPIDQPADSSIPDASQPLPQDNPPGGVINPKPPPRQIIDLPESGTGPALPPLPKIDYSSGSSQ